MDEWRDLSDDELRNRLLRLDGPTPVVVDFLVRDRENPFVADRIDKYLEVADV